MTKAKNSNETKNTELTALDFAKKIASFAPFGCSDPKCLVCPRNREDATNLVLRRDAEKSEAGRNMGLTQGIAYSAAFIVRYHGQEELARWILREAGIHSMQELIDNKVDEFDLEPLRRILK